MTTRFHIVWYICIGHTHCRHVLSFLMDVNANGCKNTYFFNTRNSIEQTMQPQDFFWYKFFFSGMKKIKQ